MRALTASASVCGASGARTCSQNRGTVLFLSSVIVLTEKFPLSQAGLRLGRGGGDRTPREGTGTGRWGRAGFRASLPCGADPSPPYPQPDVRPPAQILARAAPATGGLRGPAQGRGLRQSRGTDPAAVLPAGRRPHFLCPGSGGLPQLHRGISSRPPCEPPTFLTLSCPRYALQFSRVLCPTFLQFRPLSPPKPPSPQNPAGTPLMHHVSCP